jgi:acyl transferase domain-containing protein/NADPH:quinone reductase-like Zn-dependent oxidoreductase
MGRELLEEFPVFHHSMRQLEHELTKLGADWFLIPELNKDKESSRINEAELSQPCCTAVQLAMIDLLHSIGVRPSIVCGHSSGEIAAAYAAGFITSADAIKIAYHRGTAVQRLRKSRPDLAGGMMAVGLSADKAQEYLSTSSGKVGIACINSPSSVTLSGDKPALLEIQSNLESKQVFNRMLLVDVAYHSHHMELVRNEYVEAIQGIRPMNVEGVKMISSVTGLEITGAEMESTYWGRNLVSPVRFSDALAGAVSVTGAKSAFIDGGGGGSVAVVEIGPHSALAGPIKQTVKAMKSTVTMSYNSALVRNTDARTSTLAMAGDLFSRGVSIDFDGVNNPNRTASKQVLTNLPTYSWQYGTRHWNETRISAQYRQRKFPRHDLLGVPLRDSISTEPSWRNLIRISNLPWLSGHCFTDQIVYPAAGYISTILEALRQQSSAEGQLWKNLRIRFRQVSVGRALLMSDDSTGVELIVSLRPYAHSISEASASWKEFHIFSTNDKGEATEHCSGLVTVQAGPNNDENTVSNQTSEIRQIMEQTRQSARTPIQPKKLYSELKAAGIEYSGPFAGLESIRACPTRSISHFKIPNIKSLMPAEHQQAHCLHPVTLDLCFQSIFPVFKAAGQITPVVVSTIEELEVSSDICNKPGAKLVVATHHKRTEHSKHFAEMVVTDPNGKADTSVIHIKGIVFTTSDGVSQSNLYRDEGESLCYKVEWGLDASCAESKHIIELSDTVPSDPHSLERRDIYNDFCRRSIRETLAKFSSDDEAQVKGHMSSLLQWMRSHDSASSEPLNDAFKEKVASFGVQGESIIQVGNNMSDILTGKVDPLSVLLQNDLLYRVYSNSNTDNCNIKLAQYAQLLQFKNPNMRILEIGAGTASTSLPILQALFADKRQSGMAKVDRFVFTDISSGFFENAKTKLEEYQDVLDFKKLDIESAPDQQGFELGSFDLIIASNVLHATKSMAKTMKNVKSLLKPGGKLGLIEITNPALCWKMVFGTLSGWWLGEEEGRSESPLLTTAKWNSLLTENGFSGIDIEMGDFAPTEGQELSVMISTANPEVSEPPAEPVQVLCGDAEESIFNELSGLLNLDNDQVQLKKVSLADIEPSNSTCIVLLEALGPFLASCTQESWDKLTALFSSAREILWVTKGAEVESKEPHQAMISGLSRTIRSENHSLKFVTVDLESQTSTSDVAKQIATIYRGSFGPHAIQDRLADLEFAVRDGKILVPRLVEDYKLDRYVQDSVSKYHPRSEHVAQGGRALGLKINSPGSLDTFYWADSERHSKAPLAHEVRVELQYAALNFKDLMIAMDQLQGHTAMLIEGSGVVVDVGESVRHKFSVGDSVTVFGHDSLATTCNVEHWNVHHVPKNMSMDLAASVTVAYATALYAFRNVAQLQEGETVLIHSAAGAVGQAAVALAQHFKAGEIFITVGSEEKRQFMKENFGIPDENILSSRDLLFGDAILRKTKGRGVDVLLNSLTGDAVRENCAILAPFGRFIEIGKKDLISNARLEMRYLENNITFAAIDLAMIAKEKPRIQENLLDTVFDLIESDKIKVLRPITVKPMSELEDMFRLMQGGKHMGKLVMHFEPNVQLQVCGPITEWTATKLSGSTFETSRSQVEQ